MAANETLFPANAVCACARFAENNICLSVMSVLGMQSYARWEETPANSRLLDGQLLRYRQYCS
jgi:hypothetical protein